MAPPLRLKDGAAFLFFACLIFACLLSRLMPFPPAIFPDGYGPLEKVYSGNVTGKPRGLLPMESGASAFFYVHTILRNFSSGQIGGGSTPGGFWTIQIVDGEGDDANVVFEQSVLIKATLVDSGGGLFSTWYIHNNYTYRFATRVVDGAPLPPIVESYVPGFPPEETAAPLPAKPNVPFLRNVKVTAMTVEIPALAERTTSYRLEGSLLRFEGWVTVGEDLKAGDSLDLDVVSLFGAEAVGSETAPTGRVWWRLVGVNEEGETIGDSVRDSFNFHLGSQLIAGYEGYLHTDDNTQTVFSEESLILNEFAANGNFGVRLGADWISPPYICNIPEGAFLRIISDYWVGQLSNNDIYYSISVKAAQSRTPILQHPDLGKTWAFYMDAGDLKVSHSRLEQNFTRSGEDAVVVANTSECIGAWRKDGTLFVGSSKSGGTSFFRSDDDGQSWSPQKTTIKNGESDNEIEVDMIVEDTKVLAETLSADGAMLYLLGRATASEITNTKPESEQINQGDLIRVIVKFDGQKMVMGKRERVQGDVAPSGSFARMFLYGGTFFLLTTDSDGVRWWESTDEMKTWTEKLSS